MSIQFVFGIEAVAIAALIVAYYLKRWLDSR